MSGNDSLTDSIVIFHLTECRVYTDLAFAWQYWRQQCAQFKVNLLCQSESEFWQCHIFFQRRKIMKPNQVSTSPRTEARPCFNDTDALNHGQASQTLKR